MKPPTQWLLRAIGLLAAVGVVDWLAFHGASTSGNTVVRSGAAMLVLLPVYTATSIVATAIFWQLGRSGIEAGARIAGTIAFLLLQGLVVACISLLTLLGDRH